MKAQLVSNGATTHRQEGRDEATLEDALGKQELAALIHALFGDGILVGAEFTVYVNHNSLVQITNR